MLGLIGQNKGLRQATPETIGQAMLQAAAMGLSLNPSLGYCYLIPRRARKRRQGETEEQYAQVPTIAYATPSYRGLSDVCQRSGKVAWIRAEAVFSADRFVYRGPAEKPEHVPSLKPSERMEKHATGVYALARLENGDFLCEYLDRDTVQRIRKMSEFSGSTMWHPDKLWTEGWKKAAIRRLTKTLPKSPAIDVAIEQLNTFEGAAVEEDGEPEICIADEDVMALHALLTDKGLEEQADRWLDRLARRFGVNAIKDLPASRLEPARQALVDALGRL